MQTETLDKLYLEWSQFTKAKTGRETQLENLIREIVGADSYQSQAALAELALADIDGREPEQWAIDWLNE